MTDAIDVADLYRQLGELNATNRALVDRLTKLETREEARDEKIGAVYDWMQQARGSWKGLVAAAGFGAAVVGVLSNLSQIIGWIRGH